MKRTLFYLMLSGFLLLTASSAQAGKVTTMDTPLLSCSGATMASLDVVTCGGPSTGAPSGPRPAATGQGCG